MRALPRPSLLCCLLVVALLSCSHRVELDPSAGSEIHRLAVVVRVLSGPDIELEDHLPPGKTVPQLTQAISANMTSFELAERIRASLLERLPSTPPFATLAPTVQVETALGSLLTVEKSSGPPTFSDLKPLGVDGVLYLEVESWGASVGDDGKPALFLHGSGRLFTLDGDSTLWREPIEDRGPPAGLTGDWAADQNLRGYLMDLTEGLGQRLAASLGGGAGTRRGQSVLDTPDVNVERHDPEEMKKVLPFVYDVDAGPADAGPPAKSGKVAKDAGPVDAGDQLFPGVMPSH